MAAATGAGGSGGRDDFLARLPNYCPSAPVHDGVEEEDEHIEPTVRGPTVGIRSERARRPGVKEVVVYNEEFQSFLQPEREMDQDLATFANTLGLVVRDKISPTVPRWTNANVGPAKEAEIRAAIRDKYDIRVVVMQPGRRRRLSMRQSFETRRLVFAIGGIPCGHGSTLTARAAYRWRGR